MSEPMIAAMAAAWKVWATDRLSRRDVALMIQKEIGLDEIAAALKAARFAMTNQRYEKPRIGMERECELVDAALLKLEASIPVDTAATTSQ